MAGRKKKPVLTENFAGNLDTIESFLEPDGAVSFRRLLDQLFEEVIPTLCRFPQAGRAFCGRPLGSLESQSLMRRLKQLLPVGEEIHEFIKRDYLILYWVREREVVFLSIKHHKQLSFDLTRFWGEE